MNSAVEKSLNLLLREEGILFYRTVYEDEVPELQKLYDYYEELNVVLLAEMESALNDLDKESYNSYIQVYIIVEVRRDILYTQLKEKRYHGTLSNI